ncbi:hypothetical protein [Myroides odoratimimus]|uniref:hypothetical protein n=1 Tax=Myroides odoratimimus TaxID=76832 RepID=UPI0024C09BD3|nr:hypothetical protein [Myroides odoratimimus]WHU39094.1 hypothetical protein QNM93_05410 [Myroides odoratimimus]
MKTIQYIFLVIFSLTEALSFGQRAVVTANNYDISDNLDLQAVASIFGESKDLSDFEFRLNDPNLRINNLDLNRDGYVDYLRVVELVEGRTHLIVIQAVLGKDLFQDVATIEVEKDTRENVVLMQVVGNSYLYGPNYIYEPVYLSRPPMFTLFWTSNYRAYHSSWGWGYYPDYYYHYSPYSTDRYMSHVNIQINHYNNYYYSSKRYSTQAQNMYQGVAQSSYERQNPNQSFRTRYSEDSFYNRKDLTNTRGSSNSRSEYSVDSNQNPNYRRSAYTDNSSTSSNGNSNSRSSYSRGSSSTDNTGSSSYNRGEAISNTGSNNSRSSYSRGNSSSNASSSSNNSSYSRSSYSRGSSSYPSSSSNSSYSRSSSSSSYPSNSSSRSSYSRGSSSYPSSSSNSSYSRSSSSSYPSSSSSSNYSRSSSGSSSSGYSRGGSSSSSSSSRSSYSR